MPTRIPDGAVVTQLAMLVSDTSATSATDVQLAATPFNADGRFTMVDLGTSNTFAGGTVSGGNNSITQPTINNANRSYSLEFCGGPSTNFVNASIDYTVP